HRLGAARARLDQLLAQGLAVVADRRCLERQGLVRPGLSLSDGRGALSDRLDRLDLRHPNPNLLPESALSFEFTVERQDKNSRVRVSLFEEDTSNALIQQTQLINNVFTNTWQNVGLIRNRGVELVGELKDFIVPGLSLSNSLTYVDSKIISNPGFQSATGTTSQGKCVPYVP